MEPWAKKNEALPLVWEGHPVAPDGEDNEGLAAKFCAPYWPR